MLKVFLDAGHGGHDPGALGDGMREKDIALSVVLKTGYILKEHGVQVEYSRIDDIYLSPADRAIKANRLEADLFISVHCNAFTTELAKGIETFSYIGSVKGAKLSEDIQDSIISSGAYTLDRGTKTSNFAVLRLTNMPAVLIELGFITNGQDAYILKNRQDDLALSIFRGIANFVNL